MEQEKVCQKCGVSKPLSAFSRKATAKDGLRNNCKGCAREHTAEYYRQNKERIAEYRRQNKDKFAERVAEYRRQNKEKINERGAEYRRQNKDKLAERVVEYRRQNKDKIVERAVRRQRGLRAQKIAKTYAKQNAAIYRFAQDHRDLIGGEWHVDHICPVRARVYDPDFDCELPATGLHVPWNLDPKPASKNLGKHNRVTLDEVLHAPCFSIV